MKHFVIFAIIITAITFFAKINKNNYEEDWDIFGC